MYLNLKKMLIGLNPCIIKAKKEIKGGENEISKEIEKKD